MQLHLPNIYLRARRFAKWKLKNPLPRHLHLRPADVHASSAVLAAQPGSGATYTEIYPAYTSRLAVPEAFVKQAPKYFGPVTEQEQVVPAFVLSLRGGRLSVDNRNTLTITADDNLLVGNASPQFAPGTLSVAPATANPIFRQRHFGPPLEIRGMVCTLPSGGGAEMGNYYHRLPDNLDLTTRLRMPHYPLISPPDTRSGGNAHADRENDLTVNATALQQALGLARAQLKRDAPSTRAPLVSR